MDDLPQEIIDAIIDYCDERTFKSCRLTHSTFSGQATRRLFEHVHLAPYEDSFNRAVAISDHPNLAVNVRHVTFHSNFLVEGLENLNDFEEYLEMEAAGASNMAQPPPSSSYQLPEDLLPYYTNYCKYLRQYATIRNRILEYQPAALFRKFPNVHILDSVHDLIYWSDDIWRSPDATRVDPVASETLIIPRLGGRYVIKFLNWMLQAAAEVGLSITSVHVAGLGADDFTSSYGLNPATIPLLGELEHLELAMPNSTHRAIEQWLPAVLFAANNLTSLNLSFGAPDGLSGTSSWMRFQKRQALLLHWPNLTHLLLTGIKIHSSSFRNFLRSHCATLVHLSLCDIGLLPSSKTSNSCFRSWSSFMEHLRHDLDLREVHLDGDLMKREDSRWLQWAVVDGLSLRKHCARTRVENYVLGKGEWPFPKRDDYDAGEMHRYRKDLLECEDESWRFIEELAPHRACGVQ